VGIAMDDIWLTSAVWVGLALAAALVSIRVGIAVALIEITFGAIAGNTFAFAPTEWVSYLASVGAVLLIFLAGAEINPVVFRTHFRASFGVGLGSFLAPYLVVLAFARYLLGWPWEQAQIAGLAMSTTSVAVVYAVIVETGLTRTDLGKGILAACFITDFSTVAVLAVVFIEPNDWLIALIGATAAAMWLMPRFAPLIFASVAGRLSEIEIKVMLVILFFLAWLAVKARTEAILPAFLIGIALAPYFAGREALLYRLRSVAFAVFTPFFFLRAGTLISAEALWHAAGLVGLFLGLKMLAKGIGIVPITSVLDYSKRETTFTVLVMSSGLTFGSIVLLFGHANGIIDREQYSVLVAAVIASGVVPTAIAQIWFRPKM
jgi:Kef-type K+ transport system membrane component KefB